jgi:hypothetical protein
MCVDYTDLNKHCPKDPFGLPRIDQVIDSTTGCDLLCFLDCYSGYHQIAIKEEDEDKTVFITPFGAYCYTTMSFGLMNAGATYQRAMWMTWSSRPETPTRSSLILRRLSHPCGSTGGSSIRTSASSAYLRENYSASSSAITASKPTLRRSLPLPR